MIAPMFSRTASRVRITTGQLPTGWAIQRPPDLPTLHASSAFQSETSGSSPSSLACLGYLGWLEVRDSGRFEVLPDRFFDERAHIAALLCGEIPNLLLNAAG